MKGLKKVLCLVLSLVMVVTSLTVTAFAASSNKSNQTISADAAITLSGNYYGSKNVALTVNKGVTASVDLNGYRIYFNGNTYSCIVNNGTLSLTDSKPSGNYIYNLNTSQSSLAVIQNNGTLTLGKGIKTANINTSATNTTPKVDVAPTIINAGTLNITDDAVVAGKIVNNTGCTVNITGGYFYAKPDTSWIADGYKVEEDTTQTGCNYKVISNTATTYSIKYFNGKTEYTTIANTVTSGETFDVANAQADGTKVFKEWNTSNDGTGTSYAPYTEVTPSTNLTLYAIWSDEEAVASVTHNGATAYYADVIKAATAAAQATSDASSATVTLTQNISLSSRINFTTSSVTGDTVARTINFDLNGYTINSSADYGAIAQNKFAKLNIYDNSADGTGAIVRTNASNDQYFWSVGYAGTQIKVYGGTYSGAKYICNRGNNSNTAFQMFGGKTDTIATASGDSPFDSGVGYELIDRIYYVGAASVTIDDTTTYYPTLEEARVYLAGNVDAGETGTIKLLADQSVSKRIYLYSTYSKENEQRTFIFDFNGHTLSSSVALKGIIGQNANDIAYIKDSSDAKTGAISMYDGSSYYLHSAGYSNNKYYISDITFSGADAMGNYGKAYYAVSSGTYDFDPTDYLVNDTVAAVNNGDGTWTVIDVATAPYIVTFSDGTSGVYNTYSQALTAILAKADKSGTIKVVTSNLTETFALNDKDASVTIDLNSKSQRMSGNIPFASVSAGELTFQNGTIDLTDKTDDAAKIVVAKDAILSLSNVTFTGANTPIESNGAVFVDGVVATSGLVNQVTDAAVLQTISGKVLEDITLTITAAVAVADIDANITMKYQSNDETIEIEGVPSNDGTYAFTTEGIMLINLDKDLELEFFADGEKISNTTSITVQEYLNSVHATYPDENTQNAFMAELIDFSKKLQAYNVEANDGAAATIKYAGWEEDYLLNESPEKSDNIKETTVATVNKNSNKIKNVSISVSDKARFCFGILAQAGTNIVITKDEATVYNKIAEESGDQDIYLEKISPLDYDAEYIVTLYDGVTILHQVKYSVNSYCYVKQSDEKVGSVTNAMFNYGKAAEYFKQDDELNFGKVSYVWDNMGTTCSASRTSKDGTVTQSETVTATKETVIEGSGVIAPIVKTTADFANPAFATQVTTAPATKAANLEGDKTQTAWEKHLITNSDGSIGGSYDAATYGEGAPLNGALDNVGAGYYATNDYYNTKCTDTRTIFTGFAGYQQTMAHTDGIASVRMALNYCDSTFAANNSEKDMLDTYESLNSATVYGNGTTAAGLAKLVEKYGYTADTTTTASSAANLETLIQNTISSGKIMLIRWQQAEEARWCVVIGIDTMGDTKTNGDPVILAVPFDAYDQYQDGYQCVALPILYKWWRSQTSTGVQATNEILIITPPSSNSITTQSITDGESDNIKTNPFYAEKHLLLNADGTSGGELNTTLYGNEGTALNGTYKNSDGNYEYVDKPEYNYFGKADYYNMEDTSSLSLCENFQVFEQTMASSCGLCSTLNTLNYLGYDFTKLDNYVKHETCTTQNAYEEGEIVKVTLSDGTTEVGRFDKVQEALLNIYMQNDSYFADGTKKFSNYGGVGYADLVATGKEIGLSPTGAEYKVGTSAVTCYPTYDDFKTHIKERLAGDLPTIISWAPGSGHYETIIGFDDMGTDSPYDDVVVLADSADSHDQYQDGYNTYPACQFYGQWYNGTFAYGQRHVEYSAIN